MRFLDFLFPPRVDEGILRDVSSDTFLALMTARLVSETRPPTIALLPYSDTRVRAAIHEAKYHGTEHAFQLLGFALADYLRDCDDVGRTTSHICLVPVPLGKERRKERGFNQVEEIARRALRSLDDHFTLNTKLLERVKETRTQVSLKRRKREENMRGAFLASPNPALSGRRRESNASSYMYIVVDDVLTTGATLQAAIGALKDAGAEHVIPLALAH